jgi:RHS repeat-associated protein
MQIRELSETNNQFRVTALVYNARGQVVFETYPVFAAGTTNTVFNGNYNCTWTLFDAIGRPDTYYPLASATFSAGLWANNASSLTGDSGSQTGPTSISYSDGSNPWAIVVSDALGKVHKYSLDAFGRTNQIVEVTSGGNFTTKLAYNPVGDLTNITDNALNSIAQYYNLAGQRVALADPDMGFWQYDYDLDGRLATQTDAKLQQTRLYYIDPNGRLTRREGWTAAGACVSTNTWTYDSNGGDGGCTIYPGQLYMVTDDEGWQKFSYDVRNRTLQSVRYLAENGNSYTNQFTFDNADRLISTAYPNGGPVVTNLFDGGLHLSQVKQVGGTSFYTAKGYNVMNQLNGVNFGNGVVTTLGYYSLTKRLQQITTTKTTNVQSLKYSYDAVGNISNVTDSVYSGTASGTIGKIKYDDLNRLLSLTNASGSYSYGYNSVGNILTNNESGSSNYVYGTIRPHAVRSANGMWFTYDQNGNVVFRNAQRLDYNVNNLLYRVINTNGVVTTFGYDANGARLWEQSSTNTLQVWIGNNYEEKAGQILYHIYAGGRQVATFDKTGTNVFQYYHPDDLTSTSIQTDPSGNEIQSFGYTAYGQSRYTQNTNAFKVSRRYTGQVLDEGTGLYYYNARYYDPVLGRFTQPDDVIQDIFNPQTYNRYSYCVNNPLRYTDPTGHGSISDWWNATQEGAGIVGGWVSNVGHSIAATLEKPFVVPNAAPEPNSVQALSQQGGVWFQNIPGVGNAATAPVKAGANALLQAGMMAGPMGDEKAAVTMVEDGGRVVSSLEQRAKELHSLLDPRAQRMRTTAVTETKEGIKIISSSNDKLAAVQKAALNPGEVAAEGAGHAEVTGINAAKQAGLTPTATAASRPICPPCAQALKEQGVTPASPLKVPQQ